MAITKEYFNDIIDKIISLPETYTFKLSDLPNTFDYTPIPNKDEKKKSIRKHDKFSLMFTKLDEKQTSCLYWFELDDEIHCKSLIEKLNIVRPILREVEKEKIRVVPAMNKRTESNVLYVGVRRGGWTKKWELSNISGRMIQHLGYYYKGSTQGLQLAHWATELEFNVKLNVIQFDEDFPDEYLEALEKIMAFKLNPLCGKH